MKDARAEALRARYHERFGGRELPIPVEAIAEDLLGLSVAESEDLNVSGMLLPPRRQIWLNAREARETPGRRRFTLAHELGHWVCQCLESRARDPEPSYCRPVDLTEAADRTLEREANVFAAELLMPGTPVREVWAELEDVDACAARFDVSPTAMHWRLFGFGLVADRPFHEPTPSDSSRLNV